MQVEELAKQLHEAGREAVEKNLIVRTDVPTKGFIEWDDLTEEAREGRRVQARFLLNRYEIGDKKADIPGITPGRIVHYVNAQGDHRAAIVTQVPGTLYRETERGLQPTASTEPACVDLTVFSTLNDTRGQMRDSGYAVPFGGVLYSETKEPGTWHWPERA